MDRRDSRRIRVALSFRPHFRPVDLSILIAPSVVQKYYMFERITIQNCELLRYLSSNRDQSFPEFYVCNVQKYP